MRGRLRHDVAGVGRLGHVDARTPASRCSRRRSARARRRAGASGAMQQAAIGSGTAARRSRSVLDRLWSTVRSSQFRAHPSVADRAPNAQVGRRERVHLRDEAPCRARRYQSGGYCSVQQHRLSSAAARHCTTSRAASAGPGAIFFRAMAAVIACHHSSVDAFLSEAHHICRARTSVRIFKRSRAGCAHHGGARVEPPARRAAARGRCRGSFQVSALTLPRTASHGACRATGSARERRCDPSFGVSLPGRGLLLRGRAAARRQRISTKGRTAACCPLATYL